MIAALRGCLTRWRRTNSEYEPEAFGVRLMRVRFTLLGGALLELEIGGSDPADEDEPQPPFGFTGRCEALDLTSDVDPLGDR